MLEDFYKICQDNQLAEMAQELIEKSNTNLAVNNGNIPRWEAAIEQLKSYDRASVSWEHPYVYLHTQVSSEQALKTTLKQLMPWRKGPWKIGSLKLESEWRGDLKWARLAPHIRPLKDKLVLDVGSGNGYFTQIMALSGAKLALGLEPFLLFNYQFSALRSLMKNPPTAFVLPLRLEECSARPVFDTVFSMGVLYHQKQHMQHLDQLYNMLKPGGELVLETLIIDRQFGETLIPEDRYARMRNVWCLPNTDILKQWLSLAGFSDIKLADVTKTTAEEQRATDWIGDNTQSLKDFLDPNDDNLTIEGLPAPKRAIIVASK